jgi:hypothetical protein
MTKRPAFSLKTRRGDRNQAVSFLNRDHNILVTIDHGEVIVTTTAGTRITIPASAATLAKFVDNFANHVESNLVSIAATPVAAH